MHVDTARLHPLAGLDKGCGVFRSGRRTTILVRRLTGSDPSVGGPMTYVTVPVPSTCWDLVSEGFLV
ncbi:AIF_collapsed_G0031780.mRNA.1.CDS.1 [Saccharomyces cerevisiae]|nr:AIF_collapsed_G0031780.mRNA.1.CDS.1 [Saccharomyces cerevisiae]